METNTTPSLNLFDLQVHVSTSLHYQRLLKAPPCKFFAPLQDRTMSEFELIADLANQLSLLVIAVADVVNSNTTTPVSDPVIA